MNNTFQVVLISDGVYSFMFFNYHNLTWPNKIIRKNLKIGYFIANQPEINNNNNNFLFNNYIDFEFQIDKTNKALKKLETQSNRGNKKPGKWAFRIDQKDEYLESVFMQDLEQKAYILAVNKSNTSKQNNRSLDIDGGILIKNPSPSYVNFGIEFGDKKLPKSDDGYTGPILIPSNKFKSFYINVNGIISFDNQLSYSGEISTKQENKNKFIAILWTDIDTRGDQGGDIFHKEITDKSVLLNLKNEIKNNLNFKPKWAYEITWSNVQPYTNKQQQKKHVLFNNSFQCILLIGENDLDFYVIFNYFNLSWPNRPFNKNLLVGYSLNETNKVLLKNFEYDTTYNLDYSKSKSEEIIFKLINESNCEKSGKWIFRLDSLDNDLNSKLN